MLCTPSKNRREDGHWLANSSLCHSLRTPDLSGFSWRSLSSSTLVRTRRLTDPTGVPLYNWKQTGGSCLQPGPKNNSRWSPVRIEGAAYVHPQEPTLVWGVRCEGMFASLPVSYIFLVLSWLHFLSGFCSLAAATLFNVFLTWGIIRVVM